MNLCSLLHLGLLLSAQLSADSYEERFTKANLAYENKSYNEALAAYEDLTHYFPDEGLLFFNAGNAALRNGEIGRAIAHYRTAITLLPRHQDIHANLRYARQLTRDAVTPPEPSEVMQTLFFWHFVLSRSEALFLVGLCNTLFFGCLIWRRFRERTGIANWLAAGSGVLGFAILVSVGIHIFHPSDIAVVIAKIADVHSGNDPQTVIKFQLNEGTETSVLEKAPGWTRIVLPDKKQGWVSNEEIRVTQ